MQKAALYTSGIIFGIGTIAHVVRLLTGFDIMIDGVVVPTWVSAPGAIIAGLLTIWMLTAAQRA